MLVHNARLLSGWVQQAKFSLAGIGILHHGRVARAFRQSMRKIESFFEDLDLFISFSIARLVVWRAKHKNKQH